MLVSFDVSISLHSPGPADDGEPVAVVAPSERVVLRRYLAALMPIADFVRLCEGDQYASIAHAPVLYLRCVRALGLLPEDDAQTRMLKDVAMRKLRARLGMLVDTPNLALAAASLHPAYGHLSFVTADVIAELEDTLVQWALEFPPPAATADDNVICIDNDEEQVRRVLRKTRQHFLAKRPVGSIADALFMPPPADYDVLKFWKANASVLSSIAHLARIVLSVPASSAASERVFSSAGFIVDKTRSRLLEQNVTMLTIVRDHLMRIDDDLQSTKAFYSAIERKLDSMRAK